jgi:hypothetical protein
MLGSSFFPKAYALDDVERLGGMDNGENPTLELGLLGKVQPESLNEWNRNTSSKDSRDECNNITLGTWIYGVKRHLDALNLWNKASSRCICLKRPPLVLCALRMERLLLLIL